MVGASTQAKLLKQFQLHAPDLEADAKLVAVRRSLLLLEVPEAQLARHLQTHRAEQTALPHRLHGALCVVADLQLGAGVWHGDARAELHAAAPLCGRDKQLRRQRHIRGQGPRKGIQRLITPIMRQRKRARAAAKVQHREKVRRDAQEYARMLSQRAAERAAARSSRRSSRRE